MISKITFLDIVYVLFLSLFYGTADREGSIFLPGHQVTHGRFLQHKKHKLQSYLTTLYLHSVLCFHLT